MKILRGGSENFYTPEGGALKNCWAERGALKFLLPKGGGAPKKIEPLVRGGAGKISSFSKSSSPSLPRHIK